jgi:hypothetical protein
VKMTTLKRTNWKLNIYYRLLNETTNFEVWTIFFEN